jgi:teichuronic acid biosynthesis glycosyltransferase TuaG
MATLVSILTPVYNGIEYLPECVESVLKQTYTAWEMIVAINGHGEDGGAVYQQALTCCGDPRIRVIVQGPEVKGKVASLREAMSLVNGDWICVLDCDDMWDATKLEVQVEAMKGEARGAAVIGTGCRYFGELTHSPPLKYGFLTFADLLDCNHVVNSSSMIHRTWCHWRPVFAMDDYDMWLRVGLIGGRIYNVAQCLVSHRVHASSAFNSKHVSPTTLRETYKTIKMMMDTVLD